MNIQEFFDQSVGKWFSQRSSHYLNFNPAQSGKSNLVIEKLSNTAPDVVQLCQKHDLNPSNALCGIKITWDGIMLADTNKHVGSTLIVPIPDANNPQHGQILRATINAQKTLPTSRYSLGHDDALTLITEDGTLYSEERLWFVSPNLRLRTLLVKQADSFSQASIFSEIRMGLTQPPDQAKNATTKT